MKFLVVFASHHWIVLEANTATMIDNGTDVYKDDPFSKHADLLPFLAIPADQALEMNTAVKAIGGVN